MQSVCLRCSWRGRRAAQLIPSAPLQAGLLHPSSRNVRFFRQKASPLSPHILNTIVRKKSSAFCTNNYELFMKTITLAPKPRGKAKAPVRVPLDGGNMWESNPPGQLFTTCTGFEDRGAHQHPSTPDKMLPYRREKGKSPRQIWISACQAGKNPAGFFDKQA